MVDRVSVTAKGHLPFKDGGIYDSDYHILFWLCGAKVSAAKEYADAFRLGELFGFPERAQA